MRTIEELAKAALEAAKDTCILPVTREEMHVLHCLTNGEWDKIVSHLVTEQGLRVPLPDVKVVVHG